MVVLSIEQYTQIIQDIEMKLDEADRFVNSNEERLTHNEVFQNMKGLIK